MKEIKGSVATAIVYTDIIEETAREQIKLLCDQPFVRGCRIRIMPDVHAGAGCVIGFTADLGELVIPNIVGVDIGCGMLTVELGKEPIDCAKLDQVIRQYVPAGVNIHETPVADFPELKQLLCFEEMKNCPRLYGSVGTLGGGNHFIEVDIDDGGMQYLVIHTGSRNLGKQVAEYYQDLAYSLMYGKIDKEKRRRELIAQYKAEGRMAELQQALAVFNRQQPGEQTVPRQLCYLTGEYRDAYLHDMAICQRFAELNRRTIAQLILRNLLGRPLEEFASFETVHNYIDHDSNIIRKGAVSAQKGQKLLIPINMRDGSLICIGKGNADWNCSAPHGAGRLFSRGTARQKFTVEDFARTMDGIYTTSVSQETLDECPMAYKSMDSIVSNIGPTAEILKIIRPVYNFKAGE